MPGNIRRLQEDYSSVGRVYSGKTKEEVAYCQRCLELAGVRSKLGNRIYFPDPTTGQVNIPPDYDLWRQCHLCGSIYARHEAKQEADLTTLTEPRDSPFHSRGLILAVGESRKFDRSRRTQHRKQLKKDVSQYKEEDIKDALRKGAILVSYEEH